MRIGIVGGLGAEGQGLSRRWAQAGHHVIIGSRNPEKAAAAAAEIGGNVTGKHFTDAAAEGEVVLIAVQYAVHADVCKTIKDAAKGRIVIDITVPLVPPKVSQVQLPAGQSAALEAQAIFGPETPVVAALHHISAVHLADPGHHVDCDALFCGDDVKAKAVVAGLLKDLGLKPIDVGALRNAIALESITPLLIHINKTYKVAGSGIRITGIP